MTQECKSGAFMELIVHINKPGCDWPCKWGHASWGTWDHRLAHRVMQCQGRTHWATGHIRRGKILEPMLFSSERSPRSKNVFSVSICRKLVWLRLWDLSNNWVFWKNSNNGTLVKTIIFWYVDQLEILIMGNLKMDRLQVKMNGKIHYSTNSLAV